MYELFGASCESGVIVAKGNLLEQKAAYNYGFNLGLAFQIIDDLMDFTAKSKEMGKNLGDDFKLGKTTLPIILAWEKSNTSEKQFWNKTLKELKQDTNDFEEALSIFYKYNIFEECKFKAQEFISESKISLNQLPNTEFKEHFIGLANESTQRSK